MVKAYFTACEQAFPAKRTQLRRLSLALRRGGVEHMGSFAPYSGQDRKSCWKSDQSGQRACR